jgi:hypothetical protein
LGFTHRPEFQLLCRPCNSGKNNRLSARDVRTLRNAEGRGEEVISWHSQALWDARKNDVVDDETALRLTKMLRDNRRTMMLVLGRLLDEGHLTFLASFLRLADADSDIDIDEVLVDDSIVTIHRVRRNPRTTKYAAEQKARRLRIAFGALAAYVAKEKRNGLAITNPEVERGVREVLDTLANSNVETKTLDQQLAKALCGSDEQLREIAPLVQAADDPAFEVARRALEGAMFAAATEIAAKWNDERYVRAARDETEDA